MTNRYDLLAGGQLLLGQGFPSTKTGFALNSAYVYNSAGACLTYRFVAPVSGYLTTIYFFVTAITGTPGVTTVELRNLFSSTKPGSTVHATQTVSPGTVANKWITCTFSSPYSVVQGTPYFICFADAGWTTGNTVTIIDISGFGRLPATINTLASYTSSDGFATSTNVNQVPACVLKFADGTIFGNPFTSGGTAYTSNTRERGIKITGLEEDVILTGAVWQNTSGNISGLKIYRGESTAPGGTADLTLSFVAGVGGSGEVKFAPFTLLKNTVYRVVLTFSAGATSPQYVSIEDYATIGADLLNAGIASGGVIGTIDSGSGAWTEAGDTFPAMALILSRFPSIQHPSSPMRGPFS